MRKKLRSSRGMTLTELLVALMIVSLIGVAMTVGVNGAVKVYRDSTRLYEAETLCGTILTYLEDEFRFGRNVHEESGEVRFDSQAFGNNVAVLVDDDGKIEVGGIQLLSSTAYTSGLKVLKDECNITYSGGQVTVKIAVGSGLETADTHVEHTVKVAPLES